MITLVVALTGIQWALSSNREVLASGFAKVLLIGSFAYMINDWEQISLTVQSGFVDLGLRAGGGNLARADFLNPGAILEQGWEIMKALGNTPMQGGVLDVVGNMTDALVLGLAMIGIMLAFAVLALQIIVTLLEFKIVTLGGFVLLPFGIWSKSSFLAERPLGFVVSSGLKVLALAIVVSGARSVFDQLQPSANPDMYEALAILAAALLLAMLALFIPSLASALVTGGPALGAGAALSGGLAVAAGGALTVGAMAAAVGGPARAAAISSPARAAAGAGSGRPPPGAAPGSGAGPSGGPPNSARPAPGGRRADPPPAAPRAAAGDPAERRRQAETSQARADFHRALDAQPDPPTAASGARTRRSAALQTFFAANAGRSLLPSGESSGSLPPQLKPEEP
jgi:type IV secretion system protein TrbL